MSTAHHCREDSFWRQHKMMKSYQLASVLFGLAIFIGAMSSPLPIHDVRAVWDSRPSSILQPEVSFTNSHLSPLGFPKSSTNVEGKAKCAQSCQARPRSGGTREKGSQCPTCGVMNAKMPAAPSCAV